MFTCVHAHLLSLWHSLRVEGALDPTLSHRVEGRLSLTLSRRGENTLTLSHRRGKHSHSLTQEGKTHLLVLFLTAWMVHSFLRTNAHSFTHREGGTFTFTLSHTQTHKVEATCTHTHVFTLSLSQN